MHLGHCMLPLLSNGTRRKVCPLRAEIRGGKEVMRETSFKGVLIEGARSRGCVQPCDVNDGRKDDIVL